MVQNDLVQKKIAEALNSPLGFGETFLQDPNFHKPFKAWYPQKMVLTSTSKITYVCVDGNTDIIDPYTLRPTPISLAPYIDKTLCFDFESNSTKWVDCEWVDKGSKPCIKLQSANGNHLTLTEDHLLFDTDKGWIAAGLIKPGDRILMPSSIPIFGTINPTLEDINKELATYSSTSVISDSVFKYSEYGLLLYLSRLWAKFGSFNGSNAIKMMFWNKDMVKDLQHLLSRIGVSSRFDIDGNIFLDDHIDVKLFLHSVGVDVLITEIHPARRFETIYEVKKVGNTHVYDLIVHHPDHNFIAGGFVVHNCVHRRAGKMQPLYSTVYTPDGPKQMGDIKVGDKVCTPDGPNANVLEIFPHKDKEIYRVHLDDGTYVDAGDEHLWEVYTPLHWKGGRGKSRKIFGNRVITTKEIKENLTHSYNNRCEFNYKINPITAIKFNSSALPIPSYFLGALLGDGHIPNLSITTADVEIIDRILQDIKLDYRVNSKKGGKASTYYFKSNDTKKNLLNLGLLNTRSLTKFIPVQYLQSSVEDRLALLQGLMDTDGSSDKRRLGNAEYCTISPQLAEDVAQLARSLGCKVAIKKSKAGYKKNGVKIVTNDRYRLSIRIPIGLDIFNLDRKKSGGLDTRYLRRTIIGVEILPTVVDMQCIAIDSPEHLYITDNYTPTHNSYSLSLICVYSAKPWQNERSYKIHVFAPGRDQIKAIFSAIDAWISENPLLAQMKSNRGNQADPPMRTFINGSTIEGHIMGVSEASKGRKRGITADVVIVDEAQDMTVSDWKVINPIIRGDYSRLIDKDRMVKAYIAGTITVPAGQFYDKCKGKRELSDNESLIFIPITENKDYTEAMVEDTRKSVSVQEWHTEWMLEVGDLDTSVFRKADVDRAFTHVWDEWRMASKDRIRSYCTRYIGIDWDMNKAGTNIVVCQYDPNTKIIEVIYREEVPKGDFTYAQAVQRIPELMYIYEPNYVVMDGGAGEYQFQDLVMKLPEELACRLIKKYMQNSEEVANVQTGEIEKKPFKQTAVSMLEQKLQESKFHASGGDIELKEQLLTYKIKKVTAKSITYSSDKEHIIDGILFCIYGIWKDYENPAYTGNNIEPKRIESKEESAHPWRDKSDIDPYVGIGLDRLSLYNQLRDDMQEYAPEFLFGGNSGFREPF